MDCGTKVMRVILHDIPSSGDYLCDHDWPKTIEDDIQLKIISIFLRYGVSSEAFPLPRYPDVTFPAELVVASEEDPVVGEPDTVLAGLFQGGGEAEEDVAGVGTAGEVGGHQALRVLSSPHGTCQYIIDRAEQNHFTLFIALIWENGWEGFIQNRTSTYSISFFQARH